ncbi:MAG: glutathione S-transferase family protein [Candidatus Binataceae bacterium]
MTARLYQFISSSFCAKVRKILAYKGVDFETVEVDYVERKELVMASGQLMVPALTLDSGETIVDSHTIAMRLEELYPEPTILPPDWRGIHLALERYIDTEIGEEVFRAALPDDLRHFRRFGADHEAFFRFIHDGKFGAGFCDRMERDAEENLARVCELIAPFEDALSERAFILKRIGLADFALYGQLYFLAFTGDLKIPRRFANLRAFFDRMDRITSVLEPE